MPRGYPGTGRGKKQPEESPPGFLFHEWVAACTVRLTPDEVDGFARKAVSDTKWGKGSTGIAVVNGPVEVLEVYCRRCRVQHGRTKWCPRYPVGEHGLPR
jgi:hypothetical protein